MVIQILSYTPEQINQLAPAERATFMQLVSAVFRAVLVNHFNRSCSGPRLAYDSIH